jgi:hypothetical protein
MSVNHKGAGLIEDAETAAAQSTLSYDNTKVIDTGFHPYYSISTPNGLKRLGAIRISSHNNDENLVLGISTVITYILKTTLGTPGANEVHVKIQGNVFETVKKLHAALQGLTDATNIAYNSQAAHPEFQALWTKQNFSLSSTTLAKATTTEACTIFFRERLADITTAVTFTSTTTNSTIAFARYTTSRYTTVADGIRGDYLAVTGQGSELTPTLGPFGPFKHDLNRVDITNGIATLAGESIEMDLYYSDDYEATFTLVAEGLNVYRPDAKEAIPYDWHARSMPVNAGTYIKIGTPDETVGSKWLDLSSGIHLRPFGV